MAGISKRVSGSWVSGDERVMKTATDTITTLPAVLYSTDTTATVGLEGNAVQNDNPMLTNPVDVAGVGDKTENLFDKSVTPVTIYPSTPTISNSSNAISVIVPVEPNTTYTFSKMAGNRNRFCETENVPVQGATALNYVNADNERSQTITTGSTTHYILWWVGYQQTYSDIAASMMINTGSTALPYEPWGIKIPVLINGNITNIYIGDNPLRKSLDGTAYDTLAADGTLTQRVDSDGSVLTTPVVTQITMPTFTLADGANTISVDTTVQPSEVTVNYKGWHPVTDVHERNNGAWT